MKRTIILFIFVSAFFAYALPVAWINEIHYDNEGADHNEFVEVVVLNPEKYYLDDMALYMVNGYNGRCYFMDTVQWFELGERVGDYQFYIWYKAGIQNDCDGMHFVFKDTLLDILAYEGSFVGTTAPSTGLVFPDIGVCENPDSPDTCSIYLSSYKGSEWVYGKATPGYLNPGQILIENSTALKINQFRAKKIDKRIVIFWSAENETDIISYKLYKNRLLLAKIDKNEDGQSNYSYCDNSILPINNNQYTLSTIHLSGNETFLDSLKCSLPEQREIGLGIPFPNPFNPSIEIPFTLKEVSEIEISIFDLSGDCVYSYSNPEEDIGDHRLKVDMSDQTSGTYLLMFKNEDMTSTKKLTLIK